MKVQYYSQNTATSEAKLSVRHFSDASMLATKSFY